jgi:hypothetical protein
VGRHERPLIAPHTAEPQFAAALTACSLSISFN